LDVTVTVETIVAARESCLGDVRLLPKAVEFLARVQLDGAGEIAI
jgi:hypothetical protein